jgi:hypothetical protein
MRVKRVFPLLLIMACCHVCLAQPNQRTSSACTVAGHTKSGDLAVVCRYDASGMCYRLSSRSDTHRFHEGTAIWIDFDPKGASVSDVNGASVTGLKVTETIYLHSRQWPWFGPVSEIVCVAGKQ